MNSPLCNPHLPIYGKKNDLIVALREYQVVIVSGETGSGKTSQLPLICLEAGFDHIGITQPRRIAATSIAAYVANQCRSPLGSLVGYKVRFSDKVSRDTRIKFMTDGILLRELERDPLLRRYDVLIVDEAHERSLNIDFILGYMRTILPRRPELRLVVSSATIDTRLFSSAFRDAPVVSVSGRLFPVDIRYEPPEDNDGKDAENGQEASVDYVSAAVDTVQHIVDTEPEGDILVFMPTEQDIIEAHNMLQPRCEGYCAVLPLFGRMPLAEQQAIFKSQDTQKIVIATNIAETSLTVPDIRYVVDTGLARVKRYDPSMRITRLPVEAISQASARQRAGRSGRVQDGVCIRLYSEADFNTRPAYTLPEIQRSNLGQVILNMASLGLGNVENFPFLEPPPTRAITQGYASLFELGAIDKEKALTQQGKDMAVLPLDPPLSRMIIEAKKENCLGEMLVIAAGLCVTDMRVRPQEKKQEADTAHARFTDPLSDFLFYSKLWDAASMDRNQSLTQLRKFCKAHLLSFTRMREWQDVHRQLFSIAIGQNAPKTRQTTVAYEQLHRCILAGFLSHIAKKNPDNEYHVAKGRTAFLFPGSALYKKKPDWIVCAELVETSRLYCRIAAVVDPAWCETLAPELCKRSYGEPVFNEESGTITAKEKVMLFGLAIVENRTVAYGRINPKISNEIFIQSGLAEGLLKTHHGFFRHNKDLKEKMVQEEKKRRSASLSDSDDAIVAFYHSRIPDVTSIHDLNAKIREKGSDSFLYMKESDLIGEDADKQSKNNATLFPDFVTIGIADFPVRYEFAPSSMHDGATVEIPATELACMNEAVFDWIVPGFVVQRVRYLLESLPKSIKKQLEPVPETSRLIADALSYQGEDFCESLCEAVLELYGLPIDPDQLAVDNLPHHLSIKVMVKKAGGLKKASGREVCDEWNNRVNKIQKHNVVSWDFSDLHEKIEVIHAARGFSVYGFPSLVWNKDIIDLTVLRSKEDQKAHHGNGVKALLKISLENEMAWLEKELKFGKQLQLLCAPFARPEVFKNSLITLIENHCFEKENFEIWKKSDFEQILAKIKKEINLSGPMLISIVERLLMDFQEFHSMIKKRLINYNITGYRETAVSLKKEMQKYVTNLLDNKLNYNIVTHYNRYFSTFKYRIDRAFSDRSKYVLKYEIIRPYIEKAEAVLSKLALYSMEKQALIFNFIMAVEEFKISTFAQAEIKTLFPISQKKVDEKWEEVKRAAL